MRKVLVEMGLEEYAEMLEVIEKTTEEETTAGTKREKKDQRLTLAIRESAMLDLKNLVRLKETTLNDYVNGLIESDIEKNKSTLDEFNKFVTLLGKTK